MEKRTKFKGKFMNVWLVHFPSFSYAYRFYSAAALHAMQIAVIPTAIPSVRLSVCHTLVPYPDE